MVFEEVIDFLQKVPPFQFLKEECLHNVASSISMDFYPKDKVILIQNGPPSEFLRIIKKGGVKVYRTNESGEEVLIDYRGEGDTFGFLSLVGKDKVRANVVAVEDTICYLVDKETTLNLLETNVNFTEYFFKSHLTKYIDRQYNGSEDSKALFYAQSDRLIFTTRIEDIAMKEVITVPEDATIQEAARIMAKQKISSLIVVDTKQQASGIVTDRDLREKVVAKGKDVEEPITTIMTAPLIRVDSKDYCFEAVLKMIQQNVHHILVMKNDKLTGILTNHDLMILQGTSPLSVVKDIENQQSIEGLVPESKNINRIISLLLKEGAKASNITSIITEINDRLVKKLLTLIEKELGPPPVAYCWIVFGSEGRKEQTFKTDQDNAIIYEDPKTKEEEDSAEEYFLKFALKTRDALIQCGFPLCPGDYMASNQKWRQPLRVWKEYFSDWIHTPTSEAILASCILFDFRPLAGELFLAEQLKAHLTQTLKNQDMFLKLMAQLTMQLRPPIGFFKKFIVEKSGDHQNELNLKSTCIAPLVNIIRLFSLEQRIPETSTLERIAALKEQNHGTVTEFGDELAHTFEFLSLLRIRHQFDQIEHNKEPDNFINPNELTNFEQKVFKESCQLISKIQEMLNKKYNPGTGAMV
jgi:CBS domain-containing protein